MNESGRIALIEYGKPDAVESAQALLSSTPQISVASLYYGHYRVLRQTLLSLPVLEVVLSDCFIRVKRQYTAGNE